MTFSDAFFLGALRVKFKHVILPAPYDHCSDIIQLRGDTKQHSGVKYHFVVRLPIGHV